MFIRSFQLSDKGALIEISKHTWSGYDHLQYDLDELIRNPNSYLYVLEYKDRVVAFANLNIIDEARTAWMENMRVHWRYRKRGFAWVITKWLISKAEGLGVERLRLATTIENEATRRITDRIGMSQILQMQIFWKGNYRGIRWRDTSVPTVSCTADEAYNLLRSNPELIPEGIISYYWHSFDFSKVLFQSKGRQFQFSKGERNGKLGSLSFGYLRTFHDAPMWCSSIYALDTPSFTSALSQQLQIAKREQAQEVLCFHSAPFQVANKIPGLKRNRFSSVYVLYEKPRPFNIQ